MAHFELRRVPAIVIATRSDGTLMLALDDSSDVVHFEVSQWVDLMRNGCRLASACVLMVDRALGDIEVDLVGETLAAQPEEIEVPVICERHGGQG